MAANAMRLILAAILVVVSVSTQAAITHRYLMDDGAGTTTGDSVGSDDGTIRSSGGTGSWTTSGRFGSAWDGTTSGFISVPSAGVSTTAGSFVQWVKISTTAADWSNPLTTQTIDPDYLPYPMRAELTNTGLAQFYGIPNGAGGHNSFATTTAVKDDTWHQWITTYDHGANAFRAYIDGVQVGSTGYNNTGITVNPTWLMGARSEGGNSRCSAVFDNTAVYDHALSKVEIWELSRIATDGVTLGSRPVQSYQGQQHLYTFGPESHPQDDVVLDRRSGYTGMVDGGIWTSEDPPKNSGAWTKSGNGDQIMLPTKVDLNQGTYEGWFKSEESSSNWTNPFTTAIRRFNEPHANDAMRIEVTDSNTYVFDGPGTGTLDTGVDTTDGQWHLLTLTYQDGQHVKLFIDGVLEGESPSNYDAAQATNRGYDMLGIRDLDWSNGWRGSVGTFAYYNEVLSDAVILGHFTDGIPVPEPTSLALFALGLLLLATRRRRK